MDFHIKLQELRKQKGYTQEQLAEKLHVSRTAVSKWESGRGYPNLESLKAISKLFSITVDELLSGEELMEAASEEQKEKVDRIRDLAFGLLDVITILLFCLPFFAQQESDVMRSVSLMQLYGVAIYMKTLYVVMSAAMVLWGVLMLALQGVSLKFWSINKYRISMAFNAIATVLLVAGRQSYAAVFVFALLVVKMMILFRKTNNVI